MREQFYLFLYAVAFGVADFFIYDCIRILRIAFKHSFNAIQAEDALFWFISAVFFYKMLIFLNEGEVRFYIVMGFFSGAIAYHFSFSPIIMCVANEVISAIKKVLSVILRIFLFPLRLCLKVVKKPLNFICISVKKLLILSSDCAKIKTKQTFKRLAKKRRPVKKDERQKAKRQKK
jgi:spore cortex biosynthesis protein YabQ